MLPVMRTETERSRAGHRAATSASFLRDLVTLPIGINCHTCGVASESMERLPACPACGSVDVDAEGGDELILESLTYADDAADTGVSEADVPIPADAAAGR